MNDIHYAARLTRRDPLFTLTVVLTVALAIGANITMFSIVDAVLLRPLPFSDPDRVVQVAEKNDKLHLASFGSSVLNFGSSPVLSSTWGQWGTPISLSPAEAIPSRFREISSVRR
jgi:hypothetical protein